MIRSTFAGFTTAQLGMSASQRALDVTGQNIANINTPGYTRQRLDITSLNTQKGDFYNANSTIKVGFGVEMTRVSQLRDPFLDAQYRSQISKLGTADAHVAGFEQLATIFDESVDEGVRAALNAISSSLSTLSVQAGNKEHDTAVRSNMQVLLNVIREKAVRLQDIRDDMQSGFKSTDISDLNQILENISELNTSIKNSQILGNPALELQDQRNLLLDELGSYLPISVKYRDQMIGPDQTVEVLDVSFTDTSGNKRLLVSDGRFGYFNTDVSDIPVTLNLTDADGETNQLAGMVNRGKEEADKISANSSRINEILDRVSTLNTNIRNIPGDADYDTNLKNIVNERDELLEELKTYLPAAVQYANAEVTVGNETKTVTIANVNFTDTHGTKYELVSDTGHGTFSTSGPLTFTDIQNKNVELKEENDLPVYEEVLGSGTIKGTLDFLNKSGDFDHSDFKGLGYYEKALDSLISTFADMFNTANMKVKDGMDPDGDLDTNYDRNPLFEKVDPDKPFSALNIKIASGWLNGDYGITISNKVINDETGSTADENIMNMIKLLDKAIDFNVKDQYGEDVKFYSGSFHDCFANIENTLGIDTKSENTMLTNHISVLNQTSNSRDGVSGVQLDEEGMNLLHYNQSYNAAARLMTTLDEALDKLINGTGVVGR